MNLSNLPDLQPGIFGREATTCKYRYQKPTPPSSFTNDQSEVRSSSVLLINACTGSTKLILIYYRYRYLVLVSCLSVYWESLGFRRLKHHARHSQRSTFTKQESPAFPPHKDILWLIIKLLNMLPMKLFD